MSTPAPLASQQTQAGELKLWVPNQGYITAQGSTPTTDAGGKQTALLAGILSAPGAIIPATPAPPPTPVGASGTGVAAAALTVSLAAAAGLTNFLEGFDLTLLQVVAVSGLLTVTGLAIGTLNFQINDAPSTGLLFPWRAPFPLAASGQNVAISVVLPAIVGGGASAINVYGYRQ